MKNNRKNRKLSFIRMKNSARHEGRYSTINGIKTIYLKPGIYTQHIFIKPNVNLSGM